MPSSPTGEQHDTSLQKVPNLFAVVWGFIHFIVPVMIDRNWDEDNEDSCKNDLRV